ncbi:LamG-like jellyroll fold domain-containing protein [Dawidia soli]|uniref:Ig-like domain-containing protein n=1 Tax=Dawidia soli TaxID=2782352 RepID=A0AAP2D5M6_9BACT|nr:LamG-like jellyroll fold domain-containing protein [Dawidia soli]MBT1685809.1 Ig-like domain-containing protein [Dawidia soli]
MKHTIKYFAMLACLAGLAVFYSCSDDDDDAPTTFTIASLMADSKDLNGATSATEVPVDADLTATFNTDVDASTATSSNIMLKRTFDNATVDLDIDVSDKTITITPVDGMSGGVQYILSVGAGLKSTSGVAFTAAERSFTTAGTFAPEGALAHWMFENNGDDVIGNHDAAATDIIDVTYTAGRNANAGMAATFNGTTSIMEITNGTDFTNTKDFALSLWVKPDSSAHHGGNFVVGLGGLNGFQFELNKNDGKLAAQYELADGSTASEDTWIDGRGIYGEGQWPGYTYSKDYTSQGGFAAVVQQKWTHFVFMYNGTTKVGSAYINGELAKSFDFNKWPAGEAKLGVKGMKFKVQEGVGQNLAFGFLADRSSTAFDYAVYSNPNHNHFKGQLDDVRIYHKVLTDKEIEVMYNSEKP